MLDPSATQASPISTPFPAPRDVVAAFLRLTVDTPDLQKARLHLTKRSVESGSFDAAAVPAGSTYTLGSEEADELGRRIPVNVKSPAPGGDGMQEMTVPVVVVEEEGQWKVDLPATMERLMGGVTEALGSAVGKAMGAADRALTTAMSGVGAALEGAMVPKPAAKAQQVKKPAKAVKGAKRPAAKGAKPAVKRAPARPAKRTKVSSGKSAKKIMRKSPKKAGKVKGGAVSRKSSKKRR